MYVLITYKDEENQMKNEVGRVGTTLYSYIFDAQGQPTLSLKSLLPARFKNEDARVVIIDLPL